MTTVYAAAGCRNNHLTDPALRIMTIAVLSEDGEDVLVLRQETGGSSNYADLLAVKAALLWAKSVGLDRLCIKTHSKIVTGWTEGWCCYTEDVHWQIERLRQQVKLEIVVIPRAENPASDYLQELKGKDPVAVAEYIEERLKQWV